jgi:ABC-2 type transport system ATP-binding protein
MLHLRNFSKSYGDRTILKIPDLVFNSGLYWIKGENGSGKTTLFKSIAGMIPCAGNLVLNETIDIRKQSLEYRRRVNYSEAEPAYPGFLTPHDLLQFVGKAKQAAKGQWQTLAAHMGVSDFLHQACGTCSSGMMKKLSLTLAFSGTPDIIILDEPFITLDERTRRKLMDLIRQFLDQGTIFLISSHQAFDEDTGIAVTGTFSISDGGIHVIPATA